MYKAEGKYHPIFTGYELCAIASDADDKKVGFNTFTQYSNSHLDENEKYKTIRSKIDLNLTNRDFLASFIGVVYDIVCNSFKTKQTSEPISTYFQSLKDEMLYNKSEDNKSKFPSIENYLSLTLDELYTAAKGLPSEYAVLTYESVVGIYEAFMAGNTSDKEELPSQNNTASNIQTTPLLELKEKLGEAEKSEKETAGNKGEAASVSDNKPLERELNEDGSKSVESSSGNAVYKLDEALPLKSHAGNYSKSFETANKVYRSKDFLKG